jgi:hypothetical protein
MDKLASVSSIVADVGELCRSHDLIEEDLPKGLWAIMKNLRRCVSQRFYFIISAVLYGPSELHEIESTLRECRKIRRILMRTDMLQKIKQHDSKLSHILQTFQVSCKSLNPPPGFIQVLFSDHPRDGIGIGFPVCVDYSRPQGIELVCPK